MAISKKNIFKLCIFGLFAFISLISSVSAEQVDVGYVTSNTQVLMDIPSSGSGAPINLPVNTANTYGNIFQLWVNVGNLSISPDYIYQLELRTPNASLTNITTLQVLANNGQICNPIGFTDLTNGYPKIYFSCKSSANYISIYLYNNTGSTSPITTAQNFRWNYAYLRYFTDDNDIDLGPVISNQQQNTQQIINNQNSNTESIIASNQVCSTLDISKATFDGYLNYQCDFTFQSGNYNKSTDFIRINPTDNIYLFSKSSTDKKLCFYDQNKNYISYLTMNNFADNTRITIPSNAVYIRANFEVADSLPVLKYCTNGSQALNDTLTDDNIGSSTSDASNFINNFSTNTFGLTSIVTAPLNLIQSLTSSTCSPLELPLPYMNNKKLTLPCMTTIYSTYFGSFFTIYQTITYGIIAYWVIVRIFNQVKDFKNPEHDEIEVVDL